MISYITKKDLSSSKFNSLKAKSNSESSPRFILTGCVIVNQVNPRNRSPVTINHVGHLIGIREANEVRFKSGDKSDHIYVIDFFNKETNKVDNFKFEFNAYQLVDIEQFYSLIEEYINRVKKLELFKEYTALNPIASVDDIWAKVEETISLFKEKSLIGL